MTTTKFPKTLYVKYEEDGDQCFPVASEDAEAHAEIGEKVRVGIYDLRVSSTVTAVVEVA